MEILAHRGFWQKPEEKNSLGALARALHCGFGIETDLRDLNGEIVIAHDMPRAPSFTFEEFLHLYKGINSNTMLALNIKADGLATEVARLLTRMQVTRYFVFDMSVPDTLVYLASGLDVFTRRSELETGSLLDDRAAGLWLDSFEAAYVEPRIIAECVADGRRCAIVSPELHRKPHIGAWHFWREVIPQHATGMMLCTDFPDKARDFFA